MRKKKIMSPLGSDYEWKKEKCKTFILIPPNKSTETNYIFGPLCNDKMQV